MSSIIRKRKSPPALDIKINNEDAKPSTVEEFIYYFFRKMAEKKKLTNPHIIDDIRKNCMDIYDNLKKNDYDNCGDICLECSDCTSIKTCSGENKLLKQDKNIITIEFEIFGNDSDRGRDNTFISTLSGSTVCKIKNKVVKKISFNNKTPTWNYPLTLFILILEIAIQNYASVIISGEAELYKHSIIPRITDYYLHDISDDYTEVVMIMDYIETMPLTYENYPKTIEILDTLQNKYNIFHNDTHSDNIRQTKEGKIVLLDWGKGSILDNANPSISGLYDEMNEEIGFKAWLEASELLKNGDYFRENANNIYGGKNKKLNKTRKYKKINKLQRKLKKTRKYRKNNKKKTKKRNT